MRKHGRQKAQTTLLRNRIQLRCSSDRQTFRWSTRSVAVRGKI